MYKINIPLKHFTAYKYKDETYAEFIACGGNRAAITVGRDLNFRFSSEETLQKLSAVLADYRDRGVETMLWIGETLGHDKLSAPVRDYGYTNMVTPGGETVGAFCPYDEKLKHDLSEWIKSLARLGPPLILLDDDFRMGEFFGCCCDLHMKRIRAMLGEEVTVSELMQKALNGGQNKYRDAYLQAQGDGIRELAITLRSAVDEVDPEIRLGACVTAGRWDADDADPIEIGRILAGKTKPFVRLFGAPYHHPHITLPNSIERERTQLDWMKNEGFEVITEGDTYPRPRFACPAAYLECFDTALRADGRSDGLMKYMIDYISSPNYETGYREMSEDNADVYKYIDELFSKGECVGIKPYLPKGIVKTARLNPSDGYAHLSEAVFAYHSAYGLLTDCSIPATYEDGCVNVIFGESARHAGEAQLKNGAIIDIEAAKIFMERGIDVGLDFVSDSESVFIMDGFYDVPKEYYPRTNDLVRLDHMNIFKYSTKPSVKPISLLQKGDASETFTYLYENSNGNRFMVLPFSAKECMGKMGYFKNYYRKRQIAEAAEWLGGKPLCVYIESHIPGLYLMAKESDGHLSVGVWNLSCDRAKNVKLVFGREISDAKYFGCSGKIDTNSAVIESTIYPYEFAGIRVKYTSD